MSETMREWLKKYSEPNFAGPLTPREELIACDSWGAGHIAARAESAAEIKRLRQAMEKIIDATVVDEPREAVMTILEATDE